MEGIANNVMTIAQKANECDVIATNQESYIISISKSYEF